MFTRESDMAAPVARWMESSDMAVKREFITPWGICDLVGLVFDRRSLDHRLRLRQTRAIGSITGASLLLRIPDTETGRSITRRRLIQEFAPAVAEHVVCEQTERLIADRFVRTLSHGRLQRVDGWHPLQKRLMSVELKLSRIEQAMHQALNNLGFTEESYVALPSDVARRVAANAGRWSRFLDAGVGLLSVTKRGCRALVPAREARHLRDEAVQLYCVEKFWRTHIRDS
jgi:hypothetical protein